MKCFIIIILVFIPAGVMCGENQMAPSIQEVKKQHEARLLALPGVVSVGIGLDKTGQPAIIIGLDGSHPDIEAQLPAALEGYPVTVKIVGPIKSQ
jgi:hypothetical protein